MYHPTTRVLTVLELLQAHPALSGAELAARLEVDRRTVRRYIVMLQDLGIPIEATRGTYGSYQLRPGFKLPPLMLSDDEALAVTLALLAARHQGSALDALASEGALVKIERVLPVNLRTRLHALAAVVAYRPAPPPPPLDGAVLLQLSTAAQTGRRVRLRYQSRGGETLRDLDPYGMVCFGERWYTVGWCHLRQDVRVFRVDRVREVALETATFSRPAGFDSLKHVLDVVALAPWGWAVEVLLETTLEHAQQRIPPGSAQLEAVAEGVVLRSNVAKLSWLARALLLVECPFVVRRPPELRDELRQLAAEVRALAERAGGADGADARPSEVGT